MQDKCDHDKVYANDMLLSNPLQQNWVCRKCKKTGTDVIGSQIGLSEYDEIMRFNSHG